MEEAIRIYGKMEDSRPNTFMGDLSKCHYVRGLVLQVLGRYLESAESFTKGISVINLMPEGQSEAWDDLRTRLEQERDKSATAADAEPPHPAPPSGQQ
jgi:hypothetical protein